MLMFGVEEVRMLREAESVLDINDITSLESRMR